MSKADYGKYRALLAKAATAGREAARKASPQMMVVRDNRSGRVYEPFPICGFAWVVVKPGTSSFARYLKAHEGWSKHWHSGIYKWVSDYNQSYDLKLAHAEAYAEVLREAGFNAYGEGRLD